MSAPVVSLEGLSRWYGEVIGLNDVSVDIPSGITALLGPNGAGKSSFLRIVSGELRPSSGTALVLGEVPFANPTFHRRIGYCPEGDRFFDRLKAIDFVIHLLRLSGYSPAQARDRADAAIEEVGMSAAAEKRLETCSRGMRQRIKLAQAIAHDPELLLLDEPLTGLDPMARRTTQKLIERRVKAGASVIVSSHVLHEVEALTNRVLLINAGRIAAMGEVAEIRSLMDRHPHRIRIACPEPRRLASLLIDRPEVRSMGFEDGAVTVTTTAPEGFYRDLPALFITHGIAATGISSPDDRLQALFDILIDGGRQ